MLLLHTSNEHVISLLFHCCPLLRRRHVSPGSVGEKERISFENISYQSVSPIKTKVSSFLVSAQYLRNVSSDLNIKIKRNQKHNQRGKRKKMISHFFSRSCDNHRSAVEFLWRIMYCFPLLKCLCAFQPLSVKRCNKDCSPPRSATPSQTHQNTALPPRQSLVFFFFLDLHAFPPSSFLSTFLVGPFISFFQGTHQQLDCCVCSL